MILFSDVFKFAFDCNYHNSNSNRVNNRFQVLGIRWPPHLCFDRLTCSYLDDSAIDTLHFICFTFSFRLPVPSIPMFNKENMVCCICSEFYGMNITLGH